MEDNRYIIFEVLIEYEIDGIKKYNATSLSDYMNGKSIEECEKIAEEFCIGAEVRHTKICKESEEKCESKWSICGYHIVDISKNHNS